MNLYVCPLCPWKGRDHKYSYVSYGDTTVRFINGNVWMFPNIVLHYIHDHKWVPPEDFVRDILYETITFSRADISRKTIVRVGYLTENDFPTGVIIPKLDEMLAILISKLSERHNSLAFYGLGDK